MTALPAWANDRTRAAIAGVSLRRYLLDQSVRRIRSLLAQLPERPAFARRR